MKTQQLTTQDRFTLALNATWSVLRDPVLTKIYMRQWKRYLSRLSHSLLPRRFAILSVYLQTKKNRSLSAYMRAIVLPASV